MRLRKVFTRFLLVFAMILFVFNGLSCRTWVKADLPVHNADTGLGYATIEEAISADETLDGHTIRVDAGTYVEQVVVNKSLSLMGQDKYNTIINANGSETAILVTASNVTVSGFTVQNTTAGYGAIELYFSQGDNITDNIMKDTYYGIYIYSSSDNIITHNQALNNNYSGAYLYLSNGNTVSDCDFSNNVNFGIFLYNSSSNLIFNNLVSGQKTGISLTESNRNAVYNNNVSKAQFGIQISNADSDLLHDNNASTCDHGIYVSNSNNNRITNNTASSNNVNGISLDSSASNLLSNNTAQNNKQAGISLTLSSNDTLSHNNVTANQQGIQLTNSDNCTVNENSIAQNSYGISLSASTRNKFWYNDIQGNQYAVQFQISDNNTLLDNNFVNNTQPLTSINSTDQFDNGLEGNYWDSYNGADANHDATGDTPYSLAENNTDNHPLMGAFFSFIITVEEEDYQITFICNSTVSNVQYDDTFKIMKFNVTGSDGTSGLCRVQVPNLLVSAPQVVLVDGSNVNAITLPLSNATHASIYFTYTLSTRQVTIVSKPYYDLQEEYNKLLADYLQLNSTYNTLLQGYNTLAANYETLGKNYTQLQNEHNNLTITYSQLNASYETLLDGYTTLSGLYDSLNSTYDSLLTSFAELNQKYNNAINDINITRNIIYAFATVIVGIAALSLSTNIMFRRKINQQKKIIESFSPLELARTLFIEDVKSRETKIGKFESKYGVKIQPRNTLEDVIKSLEKKEKKK